MVGLLSSTEQGGAASEPGSPRALSQACMPLWLGQQSIERSVAPHLEVCLPAGGLGVQDVGQEGDEAQLLGRHLADVQVIVSGVADAVLLLGVLIHKLPHLARVHDGQEGRGEGWGWGRACRSL